jgi:hypothetical protein
VIWRKGVPEPTVVGDDDDKVGNVGGSEWVADQMPDVEREQRFKANDNRWLDNFVAHPQNGFSSPLPRSSFNGRVGQNLFKPRKPFTTRQIFTEGNEPNLVGDFFTAQFPLRRKDKACVVTLPLTPFTRPDEQDNFVPLDKLKQL